LDPTPKNESEIVLGVCVMNEQFKTLDKHGGITIGQELTIVKSGKNVGRFIKMNERIKELALQAGITTNLDTDYFEKDINKWIDYYSEKFAELIVRECANYAFSDEQEHKAMLKHFGVK
jgi:hypothetical protein